LLENPLNCLQLSVVNKTKLPVLFVSHGSPMFALEHGTTAPALTAWAAALPIQPTAVLIMSPHWKTRKPLIMAHPSPNTWHDFGGFPPELYQLNYPAKGHPPLAQQVQTLLQTAALIVTATRSAPLITALGCR
jgi:4,5-DOPA dioxygenase extradiol